MLTTLSLFNCFSTQLLIPMDNRQSNHLKAYGIAFWTLENGLTIEWLLNYRGGSFLMPHLKTIEEELIIRGVKYEVLAEGQVNQIKIEIGNPEVNMEIVQLEKAPKIAVDSIDLFAILISFSGLSMHQIFLCKIYFFSSRVCATADFFEI